MIAISYDDVFLIIHALKSSTILGQKVLHDTFRDLILIKVHIGITGNISVKFYRFVFRSEFVNRKYLHKNWMQCFIYMSYYNWKERNFDRASN